MRIAPFIISAVITTGLVVAMNKKWGKIPPLGKFVSPQEGFWQNAEPADQDFGGDLHFDGLKDKAEVYFDDRLVPHVFAANDEDLYFIQGYLHARFRLFQMDLQTRAAEGRASEIAGEKAITYDRLQRRNGMRFAAENALRVIEQDPVSKANFDAYTRGVNSYIHSLTRSTLPMEYKLLDLQPAEWSNLRTALLLKMMANMLAGDTQRDLPYTNEKSIFGDSTMQVLYPQIPDSLLPIVPKGTAFAAPGIVPVAPTSADSLYLSKNALVANMPDARQDPSNGSNNWVVSGKKTQSGAPILCNDPHLELSLPSIWYEMQLQTPNSNVYGVSLPGSPYIIIGFNENIAWGVTNSQRDVKDFYEVKFKDRSKKEYWFNGQWTPTSLRIDTIRVNGGSTVYDTVAYTIFGPVLYDQDFNDPSAKGRNIAVRWTAHDPSNEALTFYKLNRAASYDEYAAAIQTFDCPGQNFVFASRTGDIAIWQQGKFPARWNRQGLYVMPGVDSSYMWQGFIPQAENPHALNPERGFLESANQRPADATYPYFIPGSYITPRAISIEHHLENMNNITVDDMKKLQNDYFSTIGQDAVPILLKYVRENELAADSRTYLELVKNWDMQATPDSKGETVFETWWDSTAAAIWGDELAQVQPAAEWPSDQTTVELLKKDSANRFIDNINTPQIETLYDLVTEALKKATPVLKKADAAGKLEWAKFKGPGIYHIMDKGKTLLPLARANLDVGGTGQVINAVTQSHGPSWRMIVQLSTPIQAFGVYPAGQSGNPGSKYYDSFVDTWVKGDYYSLWFMRDGDKTDKRVKWIMKFSKS